jgi:hypothetical protein
MIVLMEPFHPFSTRHETVEEVDGADIMRMGDGSGDGEEVQALQSSFVPGKWDVICQRGKECFEHGGF